ncbi:hypothetical protein WNY37_14580 [Henriciella sp. AS95]|uniref:hypothetical protein n=1 Tax=Henriciella sp. AS95 TaxID=3135782 RepID=UPI00317836A6
MIHSKIPVAAFAVIATLIIARPQAVQDCAAVFSDSWFEPSTDFSADTDIDRKAVVSTEKRTGTKTIRSEEMAVSRSATDTVRTEQKAVSPPPAKVTRAPRQLQASNNTTPAPSGEPVTPVRDLSTLRFDAVADGNCDTAQLVSFNGVTRSGAASRATGNGFADCGDVLAAAIAEETDRMTGIEDILTDDVLDNVSQPTPETTGALEISLYVSPDVASEMTAVIHETVNEDIAESLTADLTSQLTEDINAVVDETVVDTVIGALCL